MTFLRNLLLFVVLIAHNSIRAQDTIVKLTGTSIPGVIHFIGEKEVFYRTNKDRESVVRGISTFHLYKIKYRDSVIYFNRNWEDHIEEQIKFGGHSKNFFFKNGLYFDVLSGICGKNRFSQILQSYNYNIGPTTILRLGSNIYVHRNNDYGFGFQLNWARFSVVNSTVGKETQSIILPMNLGVTNIWAFNHFSALEFNFSGGLACFHEYNRFAPGYSAGIDIKYKRKYFAFGINYQFDIAHFNREVNSNYLCISLGFKTLSKKNKIRKK